MNTEIKINKEVDSLIDLALQEDLGDFGDITSNFILNSRKEGEAVIISKQAGVIAGLPIAERVFKKVNPALEVENRVEEGAIIESSEEIIGIFGPLTGILTAERSALNFLQRLSGIATLTAEFVRKVEGTKAKILDTRKTTPGFRMLEKDAVRTAGGHNHRFGLYDMILIKENHIAATGGIRNAVQRIREKNENQKSPPADRSRGS